MSHLLRNLMAVVAGIVAGGVLNSVLVMLGPSVVPPPTGVDLTTAEGLSAGMHLLEPRHFVMPFLAHACGTLAGALAAFRIAATHKARVAYVIGAVFLTGGVVASTMVPAPAWFIALDLVGAYLPMAWVAIMVAGRARPGTVSTPSL